MTISNKTKAQAARFGRIFLLTLVPALLVSGGKVDASALVAAVVGAAEVAWRAVFPPSDVLHVTVTPPAPPAPPAV